MDAVTPAHLAVWTIAALSTLAIMIQPWGLPEAIWAVAGALLLLSSSLLPWTQGWQAAARGADVYMFLAGMMMLAELARREGLFDWLAAHAARAARGQPRRLFALLYAVGVVVTVLLSNDATAVVLTPAVYAVARAARARPLPYLLVCAFIANAASFVLPISNPANLVVFGHHMPPLAAWLGRFSLPSLLAIMATYVALRITQRRELIDPIATGIEVPTLSGAGRVAALGILATAAVLLFASANGVALGLPTLLAGALTIAIARMGTSRPLWPLLREVSWGILPLVAGLFVLVQGLQYTGVVAALSHTLQQAAADSPVRSAWTVGIGTALACNVANNLPVALVVSNALTTAPIPTMHANAMLVAVDLGPNLSVTGSLATILWLLALRRGGERFSAGHFLRLGSVVMLPALLVALATVVAQG